MFDNPDEIDNSQVPGNPNPVSPEVQSSNIANDLIEIKRLALAQLAPLLKHLDQTPEDKFRTTMMMIQAGDDASLVKTAYESALLIGDEKSRAQALLDIINEINYFTNSVSKH